MQRHGAVGQVHGLPAAAHLGVQRAARRHDGAEVGDGVVHPEAVAAAPETPSAWSRSLDPGGSIVTSSTSVASTRPAPQRPRRAAAAPAASASTAGGNPSGSANSARIAAKSGPLGAPAHSHDGRRAASPPSARRARPSTGRAATPPAPRRAVTTHRVAGSPPSTVWSPSTSRSPGKSGLRPIARGVDEQLAHHRPGHVAEPGARVEVDGVDPHLAGPQPQHLRRPDPADPGVRHARRPGRLGQLRTAAASRSDDATRSRGSRRASAGALLDVRVRALGAGVGGRDDTGARPGQQVDHRVGVAGEVGQHVRPAPAGQQRRGAERSSPIRVIIPRRYAAPSAAQASASVTVGRRLPDTASPPGTCCAARRSRRRGHHRRAVREVARGLAGMAHAPGVPVAMTSPG